MWSKISEGWHAKSYLWARLKSLSKRKLEVSVLDATAIGVSILRGDVSTASSVMFLLGIGETLEEWTHKKSVGDLARSMALHVSKVWEGSCSLRHQRCCTMHLRF